MGVVLTAVSWIALPLGVGFLTESAALGATTFVVLDVDEHRWVRTLGRSKQRCVVSPSRVANPLGHLDLPGMAEYLPGIVHRSEPPPADETDLIDHRRMLWAITALVLAGCSCACTMVEP